MPPDPAVFAASTRALLDEDPLRYRNFGGYWWFVKALLKRFYDRHAMPLLGDYEPAGAVDLVPVGLSADDMLEAAAEQYALNAQLNMGSGRVVDRDGDEFLLLDPDVEG